MLSLQDYFSQPTVVLNALYSKSDFFTPALCGIAVG